LKNLNLRTLIIMALLAALGAVFSAYLSIELAPTGFKTVEISLTPIPVILAGMLFGPLAGGIVGFVADTAGFFMGVQNGAYNPVFSVTMALFGVIAGLYFLKSQKPGIWRVTAVSLTSQIICSVMLNTLAIALFYGAPLMVLLPTRLVAAAIELPLYVWLLMMLSAALRPVLRRTYTAAPMAHKG
jgi:ECF transporter S component (folate family)